VSRHGAQVRTTSANSRSAPDIETQKTPHPLVMEVFRAFDEAKIAWVLLRDEVELAEPEGDVDLLLEPAAAGRARKLLRSLSFVRVPTLGRGSHVQYVGYHAEDERSIKFDIVTDLAFGPYFALHTRAAAGCLARRRRVAELATLAPDDAFWALLLHELIDSGRSRPKRANRLEELSREARPDTDWAEYVAISSEGWTTERVLDAARRADWNALEGLSSTIGAMWIRRDRLAVSARLIAGRLGRLFEPALALLKRPGFTVAILGPDGTGKSTLAAAIRHSFPFPARVVYMGLWQKPVRQYALPGMNLLGRLSFLWGRYLTGQYHRARGRLVLFDRYSYDAFLRLGDPMGRRDRLFLWTLAHACPAPDMVLVLDAPGAIAHARNGEHTIHYLDEDRDRFVALRNRLAHVEIVDASRSAEAVRKDVVDRIWRHYGRLLRR
jgi:thymidylate kinase